MPLVQLLLLCIDIGLKCKCSLDLVVKMTTTLSAIVTQLRNYASFQSMREKNPATAGVPNIALGDQLATSLAKQISSIPVDAGSASVIMDAVTHSKLTTVQQGLLIAAVEQRMLSSGVIQQDDTAVIGLGKLETQTFAGLDKDQYRSMLFYPTALLEQLKAAEEGDAADSNDSMVQWWASGGMFKPSEKAVAGIVTDMWALSKHGSPDKAELLCPLRLKQHLDCLKKKFNEAWHELKAKVAAGEHDGLPLPLLKHWPFHPSLLAPAIKDRMYAESHPAEAKQGVHWHLIRAKVSCRTGNKQVRDQLQKGASISNSAGMHASAGLPMQPQSMLHALAAGLAQMMQQPPNIEYMQRQSHAPSSSLPMIPSSSLSNLMLCGPGPSDPSSLAITPAESGPADPAGGMLALTDGSAFISRPSMLTLPCAPPPVFPPAEPADPLHILHEHTPPPPQPAQPPISTRQMEEEHKRLMQKGADLEMCNSHLYSPSVPLHLAPSLCPHSDMVLTPGSHLFPEMQLCMGYLGEEHHIL